jgi:uncharacterized repeat protein (TIGR03803 family)
MKFRNSSHGIIFSALCVATATAASAQTFTVIKRFNGTNGAVPTAPLTQGLDGKFYGTTAALGAHNGGTVFRITPQGTLTTIYNFCALAGCSDGSSPSGYLALGTDGNFWGVTQLGGAHSIGTIFKITPAGSLTTMYSFCALSSCPDGAQPVGGITAAIGGNYFGTALEGGANGNAGTVFKITPNGRFTLLHSFCASAGCADGSFPYAGLAQEPVTDGQFYGVAESDGSFSRGTLFKITPNGIMTTLYSFCQLAGCLDGSAPYSGVTLGTDGNIYGTTITGGSNTTCTGGCGTVYMMTPGGTLTTLHNFTSSDGADPLALVQATDGNFYGTTELGGTNNKGTIFKITPGGAFTLLHSFSAADGDQPVAGLVQGVDGNFYGTTRLAGTSFNYGTVYRLSTGLGPLVKNVPANGKVGTAVKIIGTSLTGTSSVTFNGTPATFTVVSATQISTTVPSGATSGPVQVTTPGGNLSSMPFQILQ